MRAHRPARNSKVRRGQPLSPAKTQHTALTIALSLALGIAVPVHAANFVVRSTADSGPNTLRQAALDANAATGPHVIYFLLPPHSTIGLTSGEIAFAGVDVTVQGPGRDQLTISGNHASRIFEVQGTGTLTVNDLTLRDGLAQGDDSNEADQRGGAILVGIPNHDLNVPPPPDVPALVLGNVAISGSQAFSPTDGGGGAVFMQDGTLAIDHCLMDGNFARRAGGAVHARRGTVRITSSQFTNNTVDFSSAFGENAAEGGGIELNRSNGEIHRSVIRGNHLTGPTSGSGIGAGIAVFMKFEPVLIDSSEISDNQSTEIPSSFGGGLQCHQEPDGNAPTLTLVNSTVSGNIGLTGGVEAGCNMAILNSTIANNTSTNYYGDGGAPGIEAYSSTATEQTQVTITSSLVSGNLGGGEDVRIYHDGYADPSFIGSNALVQSVEVGITLPADTIIGVDPLLAALANNGGPTRTQALLPGSPAIDAGSNPAHFKWDQRGVGHPRKIGRTVDIGAFEAHGRH